MVHNTTLMQTLTLIAKEKTCLLAESKRFMGYTNNCQPTIHQSRQLQERKEQWDIEAKEMEKAHLEKEEVDEKEGIEKAKARPTPHKFDPMLIDLLASGLNLQSIIIKHNNGFIWAVKECYSADPLFMMILLVAKDIWNG
ncbi:hypothetical protein VNI00_012084 [Paramarasmius palmivorus]|uniref:Uncharacterized protein n=1 Tax=Paramarasmius palmivorus TaxID=297713 RepID=A0AAW0CA41_9AGAR